MKRIILILVALLAFARAQELYIIAGSGAEFTATKSGTTTVIANQPIQSAIDAIKDDANGAECFIQFGNSETDTLVVGANNITFDGGPSGTDWGKITLLGNIKASISVPLQGAINLINGVSIDSKAEITNLAFNSSAIYNASVGEVTVSGGRLWTDYEGSGFLNDSTGTVTISGGLLTGSHAVHNRSAGTVNITGGQLETHSSPVIFNSSIGTVNISGGTVEVRYGNNGNAIRSTNRGRINISGDAVVASQEGRTVVYIGEDGGPAGNIALEMTGGSIIGIRAATSFAIDNNSTGVINIHGGEISTVSTSSDAVVYNRSLGEVNIYGGTIKGAASRIVRNNSSGTVNISGGNISGMGSVVANDSAGAINISGGNISVPDTNTSAIVISNSGTGTISISGGIISGIANCPVQYTGVVYNGSTGIIDVSGGKISTVGASGCAIFNRSTGTVDISGGSVITETGNAIYNFSTGEINIRGGEVSATTGVAVHNRTEGKINVFGDAAVTSENTTQGTILLANNGAATSSRLEIKGGLIENTASEGKAVLNASSGLAIISGGAILASEDGYAFHNSSTGNVNIGGSPNITGRIWVPGGRLRPIVSGDDIFNPMRKVYALYLETYTNGTIAVGSGGSGFRSNFMLCNPNFALAINSSNLVVRPAHIVSFDLNGGTGATPADVSVAQGETFPEGRKPFTNDFTMPGYSNDGEWHIRTGSAPDYNYTKFVFGEGGTKVSTNATLYLKWVAPISIDTENLGNGIYGEEFHAKVSASLENGDDGIISYSIAYGSLPDGLLLNSETGEISGALEKAGVFEFMIRATNSTDGGADEKTFTIAVSKAAQIKPEISESLINSITITDSSIVFPEMEGIEFSINNGATWKSEPFFEGLTENTEYTFLLRKKETVNYLASPNSEIILKTPINLNLVWYNPSASEYEISAAGELRELSALVRDGVAFSGKTIYLTGDIDLEEEIFTPIGNGAKAFQGIFDGQGHTVSGLSVANVQHAGLFGHVGAGGQIKNVHVIASKIKTATTASSEILYYYAGGLAGYYNSTLPIENCSVKADSIIAIANAPVGTTTLRAYSGGLAGYSQAETISNSFVVGNILAAAQANMNSITSTSYSGGLVGSTGKATIENSYAKGSVLATAYRPYSGGLAGHIDNASATIINSYTSADVSASSSGATGNLAFHCSAGGLIGYSNNASTTTTHTVTIIDSYSNGNILSLASGSGSGTDVVCNAGGLVSWVSNSAIIIKNSYSNGNVVSSTTASSNIYSGGLIGQAVNVSNYNLTLEISNSYAIGDVSAVTTAEPYTYNSFSGGLVGFMINNPSWNTFIATVENSYASGNILATGPRAYSGGIFGRHIQSSSNTSVYYNSEGANNAAGRICNSSGVCDEPIEEVSEVYGKPYEELTKQGTFIGWNFDSIWDIIEDTGTPFLRDAGYDFSYSLFPQDYVYTGSQIKPEPAVYSRNNSGAILTKDVHYTLSYGENKNVGEGTIIVTGISSNNKGSSGTVTFNITPKELTVSNAQVASKIYDGATDAAISGGTLQGICGSDDVSLANFKGLFASANVGNGISVSSQMFLIGDKVGNYELTQPALVGNITPKALAANAIQSIPAQLYNYVGGQITPDVVVKDGAITLAKDVDYTVSYDNNIEIGKEASVTITGKGNYGGLATANFEIIPFLFVESFESGSGWTLVNGSQTNKWMIGTATSYNGIRSAYISNNNSANQYATNASSTVHIYRDITFPISNSNFTMTFWFKGIGEANSTGSITYDYMQVRHSATNNAPSAGSGFTSGTLIGTNYLNNPDWSQKTITLPAATFSGQTRRLVFTWINDVSGGNQPPAAIDDINIYVSGNMPSSSSSVIPSSSSSVVPSSSSSVVPSSSSSSIPSSSSSSNGGTPIRLPQIAVANSAAAMKNAINLQTQTNAAVRIYNAAGTSMLNASFVSGVYNISLNHLPRGVYIVKITFGNETQMLRVPVM